MSDPQTKPGRRGDYPHFLAIPTRWMDNDVYLHVNNVVYYSFFDTVINRYLIDAGGLDYTNSPVIGIAVETMCRFRKSFAYPEVVDAGLRVGHLGNSSVRYEVGLFGAGEDEARAEGHFVHVFVERATNKPVPIPPRMREALARLKASPS
jgi:acyl-CoA thioester hydrolase